METNDITTTTARRFPFLDLTGITVTQGSGNNWRTTVTLTDGSVQHSRVSDDFRDAVHHAVAAVRGNANIGRPVTVTVTTCD